DVSVSFVAETDGPYLVVVSGWSDYDLGEYTVARLAAAAGPGDARQVTLPTRIQSAIPPGLAPLPSGFGGGAEFLASVVEEECLVLAAMSPAVLGASLTLVDATRAVVAENGGDGYTTDATLVALLEPGAYVLAASTYYVG